MRTVRLTLALLVIAAVGIGSAGVAQAHDNSFRFKWPYQPGVSHPTTSFPFEPRGGGSHHGDAWDIVIGNDSVRASAEGVVYAVFRGADPNSCDPTDGGGFGNYVMVRTPTPDGDRIVTYAHLASTPLSAADEGRTRVLQGQAIGVQGKTGHTVGSEPPNNCGTHLHFQFDRAGGPRATASNPAHPPIIDGLAVSNTTPAGASTNSTVGDETISGSAIRDRYVELGAGGSSWAGVGWTADQTGSQAGCPASFARCRLYPHYVPDPAEGHWGMKQDFRLHPDGVGREYSALMAARWARARVYWVRRPEYQQWLLGGRLGSSGAKYAIGMPIMERIGNFPGLCEASIGCQNYQRFHLGYTWTRGGVVQARFCPDVAPAYPNPDYAVTVADVFAVMGVFGAFDNAAPAQAWQNAWRDINGDGSITVSDLMLVNAGFGQVCYPR